MLWYFPEKPGTWWNVVYYNMCVRGMPSQHNQEDLFGAEKRLLCPLRGDVFVLPPLMFNVKYCTGEGEENSQTLPGPNHVCMYEDEVS